MYLIYNQIVNFHKKGFVWKPTAGSVENIANLTVVTIESNPIVAVYAGIVEGTAKGLSGTPPDTPPLVNNPISSTVSDVVNNVFTFIKEKLDD